MVGCAERTHDRAYSFCLAGADCPCRQHTAPDMGRRFCIPDHGKRRRVSGNAVICGPCRRRWRAGSRPPAGCLDAICRHRAGAAIASPACARPPVTCALKPACSAPDHHSSQSAREPCQACTSRSCCGKASQAGIDGESPRAQNVTTNVTADVTSAETEKRSTTSHLLDSLVFFVTGDLSPPLRHSWVGKLSPEKVPRKVKEGSGETDYSLIVGFLMSGDPGFPSRIDPLEVSVLRVRRA